MEHGENFLWRIAVAPSVRLLEATRCARTHWKIYGAGRARRCCGPADDARSQKIEALKGQKASANFSLLNWSSHWIGNQVPRFIQSKLAHLLPLSSTLWRDFKLDARLVWSAEGFESLRSS